MIFGRKFYVWLRKLTAMFKRIVFNQFHDLIRQGKDPMKARVNVLLLVAVLVMLPLIILFFLNIDWLSVHVRCVSGLGIPGRLLGKLLGLSVLASVLGMLFLLLGKKARFQTYLNEFYTLNEQQRQQESKRGLLYFLVPFFMMLALVLYLAYAMA